METNRIKKDRRYTIGFSLIGSLIIILFFVFINYTTGSRFPWSVFPAYAVIWWPIAVIFSGKHSAKMLSLVGSLLSIALFFTVNYLTSWDYPWFLFPSFAVLWWPFAVFWGNKHYKVFSIIGCVSLIAFFVAINLITSPYTMWFHLPSFAVIWWPLSVFFAGPKTNKAYSLIGSLLIIVFLALENMMTSFEHPWTLLAIFPVLMWPAAMLLGKRLGKLAVSLICCSIGIVYYAILNILVFKGFPWAIFPAYALIWWPLAVAFAKRGKALIFSLSAFILSCALFIAVNIAASPHTIWAVYPIFVFAWWPLSVYFFVYRRRLLNKKAADQASLV